VAAADDLFDQMCRTKAGWTMQDLDTLYLGFGFGKREGGKHVVYRHPEHMDLRATVTRARHLPTGYIQHAVKLIRQLKAYGGKADD
jgi:hypothetical protein